MPVQNLNAFRRRMKEISKLPERRLGFIVRGTGVEAFSGCIEASAVDTGELRLGWFATLGSPSGARPQTQSPKGLGVRRLKPGQPIPGDEEVGARMKAIVEAAPAFGRIWFTNNTPHASVIETGGFQPKNPGPSKDPRPGRKGRILVSGGYSTQAPRGMLRNGQIRAAAFLRRVNQAQRGVIGGGA